MFRQQSTSPAEISSINICYSWNQHNGQGWLGSHSTMFQWTKLLPSLPLFTCIIALPTEHCQHYLQIDINGEYYRSDSHCSESKDRNYAKTLALL